MRDFSHLKAESATEKRKLVLVGRSCDPNEEILTLDMAYELRHAIPPIYRLASSWHAIYSSSMHGFSLRTLYEKCKDNGSCILVVKSTKNKIFGAYCSDELRPHPTHYGNSTCFLWEYVQKYGSTIPEKSTINIYKSTGKGSMYIFTEPSFIAIGCGNGMFGLWIDSNLEYGASCEIPVFENKILGGNTNFVCHAIELWSPQI